jgi:hypothetical protein
MSSVIDNNRESDWIDKFSENFKCEYLEAELVEIADFEIKFDIFPDARDIAPIQTGIGGGTRAKTNREKSDRLKIRTDVPKIF